MSAVRVVDRAVLPWNRVRMGGSSDEGLAEGLVVCRGWGLSPTDATASGLWCLFAVQITVIKHGSEPRTQCLT